MTPKNERRIDLAAALMNLIILISLAALSLYLMVKSYHIILGN